MLPTHSQQLLSGWSITRSLQQILLNSTGAPSSPPGVWPLHHHLYLTRLLEEQEEGRSEMPCDLHIAIQVCNTSVQYKCAVQVCRGITSLAASWALCANTHPPRGSAIIRPISQMGRTSLRVIQCLTLLCTTAEGVGTLSSWLPGPAPSLPPCSSHCVLETGPESLHADPTIPLGGG